ncbi:hypothetical protein O7635_20000 [Asanoa sp. WMMD1127]|uniref:hypothetical protein n=1 Tax=Asanoa sp. WMMD1127 TaxID=3016107 RepID=UPI002417479B|nr:hypothetical protein [Asanoa sp. WMMD1127]MDG4824140.1 hypothetical protein [Asanoa sp. WMMD1127]
MDLRQLPRCAECGWRRPARAPSCATCLRWLDDDLRVAWRAARREYGVADADVPAFAATVVADPRGVDWRVYDAALGLSPCLSCGAAGGLGAGPESCLDCTAAHDWRWLAAETDRPGVPPGNEHAIRVATAVARIPHRFPAHMVPRYAAFLPMLIAGTLPAGGDARAAQRWLNTGGTLEALDAAPSTSAIADLVRHPVRTDDDPAAAAHPI